MAKENKEIEVKEPQEVKDKRQFVDYTLKSNFQDKKAGEVVRVVKGGNAERLLLTHKKV
jgi:hypothetical protein